mmetsp:Transcript_54138/g.85753  ORF Transcript_54138/g.85753 Transcript_54138/m.85753 type:complete len:145 (-) Transcript_54138:50-484(-)
MLRFAMIVFVIGLIGSDAASVKIQQRRAEMSTVAVTQHRQRSHISMAAVMSGHAPAPAVATAPAAAPPAAIHEDLPVETKPPKLPEQGYEGKDVRHENFKSVTKDWGSEYGPTTQKPFFKSAAGSTFSVALAILTLAAQSLRRI